MLDEVILCELNKLPKTVQKARELKSKYYFTNKCCKFGHCRERLTTYRICVICHKKIAKEHRNKYREKRNEQSQKWRENNRELARESVNKNRQKDIEKSRFLARKYYKQQSKDPKYRLNNSISSTISHSLKDKKGGKTWESIVGYTLVDLVNHLEKQFTPEMNWDNYGSYWHLDHIKPRSLCTSFEECWKLENLQPLKAFDNFSKNNRYIGHPSNPQWVNKKDNNNNE